jgi:predicted DCC family thiol-disulfide oxidoreductase YuxK
VASSDADAADLHLYFDPVCPFCWLTSKWVRMVAARRRYRVDWRFISLRLVNSHVDYAAHFPPEYEAGHTAGLRLLRMAARTRAEYGREAVGRLYEALGARIFDGEFVPDAADDHARRGTREFVEPVLAEAGLPAGLADALDDPAWDAVVEAETDEALALTGKDVGTPILHFEPADGAAFFGPVISRLPSADEAEELWDHVVGLARFPGFAELKRSLRELPQLRALGVADGEVGVVQEWEAGSRRLKGDR